MKIDIEKFRNNILLQNCNEYKYLSPNIIKNCGIYYLLFCNRQSNTKFYGEICFALSKDLYNWKKLDNIFITPKKTKYESFVSPSVVKFNNIFYLFIEGQIKNNSSIIIYMSEDLKSWKFFKNLRLSNNNKNFFSPYAIKIKNKIFCYYAVNKTHIFCSLLDSDFNIIETFLCFSKSHKDEQNCIYAPMVLRYKNKYLLFYSAFRSQNSSNLKIATSPNGKIWKKHPKVLFKLNKKIKIISEPFVLISKSMLHIFFEYKISTKWNIGVKTISIKILDNWITN